MTATISDGRSSAPTRSLLPSTSAFPARRCSSPSRSGDKDIGRHDSLTEYFANQISRRILADTLSSIEGRFLNGRFLKSLEYDNNLTEKNLFVDQIKNSRTPFAAEDWSSKETLPQATWEKQHLLPDSHQPRFGTWFPLQRQTSNRAHTRFWTNVKNDVKSVH